MHILTALVSLATVFAVCLAKVTPVYSPAQGAEFKLIATNESSPIRLEHFLRTGHGVRVTRFHGENYLGLSPTPDIFTRAGGSLGITVNGSDLLSQILDEGYRVQLGDGIMQGSDFGWEGDLLIGDIDRGGQPGYFTICTPAKHPQRHFVYWRTTGKHCLPRFNVTFLHTVSVDST